MRQLTWLFFALLIFVLLPAHGSNTKRSIRSKESRTFLDPEVEYREYKVRVSRQLGVTCNYCHDVKNFKSDKKKVHAVAKDHMRIVDLLNKQGFTKRRGPKADCYMCHRGKAVPDYKEVLDKKNNAGNANGH